MDKEIRKVSDRIREIYRGKGRCIAAADGRCASGKSTFAAKLARMTGGALVHMDDFFLRPEQRTPERYRTPGENVDHERFLEEVLKPLNEGKTAVFHPFDCTVMKISDEWITAEGGGIVIVEGSYSHHPDLREYYDLLIFLDVNPEKQMERIQIRNPDKIEAFRTKWIPFEEMYFEKYEVKEHAQIVIDTSDLF